VSAPRRFAALALIGVVTLALAAVASGCGPSPGEIAAQHKAQCFANQRQIKMAIDLVNADSGIYPDVQNVVKELKVSCPDGGIYAFDPNTNTVSCSIHGVAPASAGQ
jgi:hypothetical protein